MEKIRDEIGLRVILFDEVEGVRKVMAGYLRAAGCEVYAFSQHRFCPVEKGGTCPLTPDKACADVIIADVHAEIDESLDLVEEHVRKGCKAKAFALMSTYGKLEDRSRLAKLGVRLFQKPFPMETLAAWLFSIQGICRDGRSLIDLPPDRTEGAD